MAYVEHVAQLSDSVTSYAVDIEPSELYAEAEKFYAIEEQKPDAQRPAESKPAIKGKLAAKNRGHYRRHKR